MTPPRSPSDETPEVVFLTPHDAKRHREMRRCGGAAYLDGYGKDDMIEYRIAVRPPAASRERGEDTDLSRVMADAGVQAMCADLNDRITAGDPSAIRTGYRLLVQAALRASGPPADAPSEDTCRRCSGSQTVGDEICSLCGGTGRDDARHYGHRSLRPSPGGGDPTREALLALLQEGNDAGWSYEQAADAILALFRGDP